MESSSLVAPIPDIYTRTEKLSDSLMDQSALNDDLDTSDSGTTLFFNLHDTNSVLFVCVKMSKKHIYIYIT